ncbi:hypothetical protein QJR30_07635 [Paraclostridium sordellii]|uniref:hypothetical protein n=1 Tax=Paraclostridium sordellii TaxID=1505 RepID=UPI0030D13C98
MQYVVDTASVYFGKIGTINPKELSNLESHLLGVTRDTIKVEIKPNIKEVDFNGRKGRKVKDMNRILGWEAKAECEALEFTEKVLTASMFVKSDAKYVPAKDMSYNDVVLVGKVHGTSNPIIIHLKNAYNGEGLSFEQKDGEESGFKMAFVATYEPDSDDAPVDVYMPESTFKLNE